MFFIDAMVVLTLLGQHFKEPVSSSSRKDVCLLSERHLSTLHCLRVQTSAAVETHTIAFFVF